VFPWSGKNRREENRPVIRLLQAIDVCYARIYHHLTVRSPVQLPKRGAAILICNHTSHLDPLLIQAACPRLITWMMTKDFYDLRFLGAVFRTIGAIRVERSGRDMAATRAALRALEDGRVLGIFPEGRLETSRDLLPFHPGAAMIAMKANVKVYPAYLDGTQRGKTMAQSYMHRQRATLAFGAPIDLSVESHGRDRLEHGAEMIRQSVEDLRRRFDSDRHA
jgi:1-acyl-sn-glycerol-3-phosphate acyltransferase